MTCQKLFALCWIFLSISFIFRIRLFLWILNVFRQKILPGPPIWTGKNGFANFFIFTKILNRKVRKSRVCVISNHADTCPHNQRLHWHSVRAVNDYANTVSALSTTMGIPCQHSQQPRQHRVNIVNDYADNIFAKTKNFGKLLLPVHMGPRWSIFFYQASKISWHCPFNNY